MIIFTRNDMLSQKLKDLVTQVDVACLLVEDLEDPQSEVSRFIDAWTLNFVLKRLDEKKRRQFVRILRSADEQLVWDYIDMNIPLFTQEWAQELQNEMKRMYA